MNFFLLFNTKEDILKNVGNQTVDVTSSANDVIHLEVKHGPSTTCGWVNDVRFLIFRWTIPLTLMTANTGNKKATLRCYNGAQCQLY